MKRWPRLIFYLLINVLVSGCTTALVLFLWTRSNPLPFPLVTPSPVPLIGSLASLTVGPTETLAPSPTPTFIFQPYEVQPGDTLGTIAEQFGVLVEDLIRFNGLTDPNAVGSGQVLLIPVTPEATEPPATETPSPEGGTDAGEQDFQLEITTIVAAGVLADERVDIEFGGESELPLLGWTLEDGQGNVFQFPQLTLFQAVKISVFTKPGANTSQELYWGRDEAVWGTGENALLRDPEGNIRATYRVP